MVPWLLRLLLFVLIDAVIASGGTTTINSKEVHNIENGRIYGGKEAIQTKVLENRRI